MRHRRSATQLVAVVAAGSVLSATRVVRAGDPFEIQVYDGTANHPGVPGLELHVNDWATGNRGATPPEAPLNGQFHATLEPSLGVLPFWEIGAYLQSAIRTDVGVVGFAGAKLRSKFVTPPSFDPHWRLGANVELSYLPPVYDHDSWGAEFRPILAFEDDAWIFAFNPILDQALSGGDAGKGPSLEPCAKLARKVGPVALGIEYYATLGWLTAIAPLREEEHQIFQVVDVISLDRIELNFGLGEGLTPASEGLVLKAILGYTFEHRAGTAETPGAKLRRPVRAW